MANKQTPPKTILEETESEVFKAPTPIPVDSPASDEYVLILATVKASEKDKVKSLMDHFAVLKSGHSKELNEAFTQYKKAATSNKRISDVSSLSSNSHSSSSTGYLGDIGSSAGSGISSGSSNASGKRDRLSIMPEATVEAHKRIAPLPNPPQPVILEEKEVPPEKEAVVTVKKRSRKKLRTKSERDTYRKATSEEPLSEEIPVVSPIRQQQIQDVVDLNVPRFSVGDKVFAKWVDKTDVRFWPGVVSTLKDDKYFIKFDDGLEKNGLKAEDFIPVASLEPGHRINVCSDDVEDGIFNVAKLTTHPDFSDEHEVKYNVEFEPIEGLPQIENQLVSYKRVHLTNEQAKVIRNDIGGVWNTPSVSKTNADISLDNLLSGKRTRSKLSTKATPSSRKSKRGGHLVETSMNEDEEDIKTPSKNAKQKLTFATPRSKTKTNSKTFSSMFINRDTK